MSRCDESISNVGEIYRCILPAGHDGRHDLCGPDEDYMQRIDELKRERDELRTVIENSYEHLRKGLEVME